MVAREGEGNEVDEVFCRPPSRRVQTFRSSVQRGNVEDSDDEESDFTFENFFTGKFESVAAPSPNVKQTTLDSLGNIRSSNVNRSNDDAPIGEEKMEEVEEFPLPPNWNHISGWSTPLSDCSGSSSQCSDDSPRSRVEDAMGLSTTKHASTVNIPSTTSNRSSSDRLAVRRPSPLDSDSIVSVEHEGQYEEALRKAVPPQQNVPPWRDESPTEFFFSDIDDIIALALRQDTTGKMQDHGSKTVASSGSRSSTPASALMAEALDVAERLDMFSCHSRSHSQLSCNSIEGDQILEHTLPQCISASGSPSSWVLRRSMDWSFIYGTAGTAEVASRVAVEGNDVGIMNSFALDIAPATTTSPAAPSVGPPCKPLVVVPHVPHPVRRRYSSSSSSSASISCSDDTNITTTRRETDVVEDENRNSSSNVVEQQPSRRTLLF